MKKDKQISFVLFLLFILGVGTLYFYMSSRGLDFNNLMTLKRPSKQQNGEDAYPGKIKIESKAFVNEGAVAEKYTCQGADVNPPLQFLNVPKEAKSLALVVEDPDAPYKTWIHWIVYNIGPKTNTIWENSVPWGAELGENDFGVAQYRGPCPPLGKHRYIFRLYALDTKLTIDKGADIEQFKKGIEGHVLDVGELIGVFEKK